MPVEQRDGLVGETAGGRIGTASTGPVAVRRHLERVAVRHAGTRRDVVLDRAVVEDLLAGDPRVPRRDAAGAVRVRPAEHREALDDAAVAVDDELRVAAADVGVGVVAPAAGTTTGSRSAASGSRGCGSGPSCPARARVRARAVEDARRGVAVAHRVSLARDHAVAEPAREVEVGLAACPAPASAAAPRSPRPASPRPCAPLRASAEIGPPSAIPPPTAAEPLTNVLRVRSSTAIRHPSGRCRSPGQLYGRRMRDRCEGCDGAVNRGRASYSRRRAARRYQPPPPRHDGGLSRRALLAWAGAAAPRGHRLRGATGRVRARWARRGARAAAARARARRARGRSWPPSAGRPRARRRGRRRQRRRRRAHRAASSTPATSRRRWSSAAARASPARTGRSATPRRCRTPTVLRRGALGLRRRARSAGAHGRARARARGPARAASSRSRRGSRAGCRAPRRV